VSPTGAASAPALRSPGLLAAAWLIARKDLAIEYRTRSAFFSALVFALLAVTIFYFVWDQTAVASVDVAPGILWVIFTFSGILGLHRSFGVEQASRAVDALIASPVDREAIFLGKALANAVFVLGVQALTIPAVALFYNLPLGREGWAIAGIALLAAVGLVSVGTLFSAMAVNTRLAELLLPMLSLPFFIPVVLPAAQATARLLNGRPLAEAFDWLRILVAFDLVFVVACALAFPFTLEE
jgi:heme exporter protein B